MATSRRENSVFCGSREISGEYVILALIFLALTAVIAESPSSKRTITIKYNEQCGNRTACNPTENSNGSYNNLVHVIAKGPDDTLHYLWSSIGAPGVLLVRTTNKASLTVDWDKLMGQEPQALMFPEADVLYSVAFVFGKLIEYNDTKDMADLSQAYPNVTRATLLEDLHWQDSNKTLNYSTHCGDFTSINAKDADLGTNATFSLKFQAFNKSGRSSDLPHLQSTANTSQIELILDNLGLHYKQSRFAIELLVLHDQQTTEDVTLKQTKSIDDEYTPSVFLIYNLKVPSSSKLGSFSQWKPVTYNDVKKAMSNAVQTKNYGVNTTNYFQPKWSIAHAYYPDVSSLHKAGLNVSFGLSGDGFYTKTNYSSWWSIAHAYYRDVSSLHKAGLNVSFGLSGDGFYTKTNYSSWTMSIGYGKPPEEKVSLAIIIIISAGLGIPLILILFGGIYIGVSKSKQSEYEPLNDAPASPSINS
ncbi:glycosylated lysosomal membrane protein A-like [Amphiura filiformis]|uniref:glycosylated lysosomal membrane protein A-like n=1 Tax=Amphiura filiformis TaxID=82378 RepID=UPI003B227AB8